MDNKENKILYSPMEFAKISGIGQTTTYKLCHVAGFPATKIGRKWLIHKDAASEWLAQAAHKNADISRA